MNWAHEPHGLWGWGTTCRELKVPSEIAPDIQGTVNENSFWAKLIYIYIYTYIYLYI